MHCFVSLELSDCVRVLVMVCDMIANYEDLRAVFAEGK